MKCRGTTEYQGNYGQLNQGLDLIISAMTPSSMDAIIKPCSTMPKWPRPTAITSFLDPPHTRITSFVKDDSKQVSTARLVTEGIRKSDC